MSLEKLKEVAREIKSAQKKLLAVAKDGGAKAMGEAFAPILTKYAHEVKHVSWVQYTPHFNDGDTCEFSVHDLCLVPAGNDGDDDREYEIWGRYDKDSAKVSRECYEEIRAVWNELKDESIMQAIFGDHAQVTITKDTVTVDSYDHD